MQKIFGKDAIWSDVGIVDASDTKRYHTQNKFGHYALISKKVCKCIASVVIDGVVITYESTSFDEAKKWASAILDLTHLMEHLNYTEFNSRTLLIDPVPTLKHYAMSYAALTHEIVDINFNDCAVGVL
jgi:hypothetical protein